MDAGQKDDLPRIFTSGENWLKQVVSHYQEEEAFVLVDDGGLGVDPSQESLFDMGQRSGLEPLDILRLALTNQLVFSGLFMMIAGIVAEERGATIALLAAGFAMMAPVFHIYRSKRPRHVDQEAEGIRVSW